MFAEVVATSEALIAQEARELLLSCVGADVALQFVGASEAFPAEQPVADEGSFARVPTQVSFQMRGLAVDLSAAGNVAAVDRLLAQGCGGRAEPFQLLAVRAIARRPSGGGAARVSARASGWFEPHGIVQDSRSGYGLGLVHVLRDHVL